MAPIGGFPQRSPRREGEATGWTVAGVLEGLFIGAVLVPVGGVLSFVAALLLVAVVQGICWTVGANGAWVETTARLVAFVGAAAVQGMVFAAAMLESARARRMDRFWALAAVGAPVSWFLVAAGIGQL